MPLIHTVVENLSRYPIDLVWENAQDLEHVGFLHKNTNFAFTLLNVERVPGSKYAYDSMTYRTKRKAFFVPITSFGFRRIIRDNNLHQIEHIPLLGITSALNSQLIATGNPEFPTLMRDEVVMEVPLPLYWLRKALVKSLNRHARIQCQEDESFRERRLLLQQKSINLPYRVFFKTTYEMMSSQFSYRGKDSYGHDRDTKFATTDKTFLVRSDGAKENGFLTQ